jgi:hypothetical protein
MCIRWSSLQNINMWDDVSTAPFDRDLELAVIDNDGVHALVFPCRRIPSGWVKVETRERLDVRIGGNGGMPRSACPIRSGRTGVPPNLFSR